MLVVESNFGKYFGVRLCMGIGKRKGTAHVTA